MLENAVQRKLIKGLKDRGWFAGKIDASVVGFPDVLAVWGDRFLLIEVKKVGGRLSAMQRVMHRILSNYGVMVTTLYGPEEVEKFLDSLNA